MEPTKRKIKAQNLIKIREVSRIKTDFFDEKRHFLYLKVSIFIKYSLKAIKPPS